METLLVVETNYGCVWGTVSLLGTATSTYSFWCCLKSLDGGIGPH